MTWYLLGGINLLLTKQVVNSIRQRQQNGLPTEVHDKIMLHICDTIGISFAAYKGSPVALKSIHGIVTGASGGSSRVLGMKKRFPPAFAAFSNTALAHALDYDDINDFARIHPTPITLSAALAVADITEDKTIDLVTAVALGNELLCRLGSAIEPKGTDTDSRWFLSQLFGYIGAAVVAGLVLDLDDSELMHAIGIAYMQLAGGKEAGVGVGSNARAIYPAFASLGGVQAALLAKQGVTAPKSTLDGKAGLFQIYFNKNLKDTQRESLLDPNTWAFMNTSIKFFPSCRYSHPYIQSTLILRHKFKVNQIKKIVIQANKTAAMLCYPLEDRCKPKTLQDAKFSIPFMVAFSFIYGEPKLNNLNEKALHDSRVLELAKCIEVQDIQANVSGLPKGNITVFTTYGRFSNCAKAFTEFTSDQVRSKFLECCLYANIDHPDLLWDSLNDNVDYNLLEILPILD